MGTLELPYGRAPLGLLKERKEGRTKPESSGRKLRDYQGHLWKSEETLQPQEISFIQSNERKGRKIGIPIQSSIQIHICS